MRLQYMRIGGSFCAGWQVGGDVRVSPDGRIAS